MKSKIISIIYKFKVLNKIKEISGKNFCVLGNEESAWLKYLINSQESVFFFDTEEIEELKNFLKDAKALELSNFMIKNKPKRDRKSWGILEPLIKIFLDKQNMILYYNTSNSNSLKSQCFPYKIEFEFYKNEWYLLWLNLSENNKIMKTQFSSIKSFETIKRDVDLSDEAKKAFFEQDIYAKFCIDKRYSDDLKRILLTLIDFNPILDKDDSEYFIFKINYKFSEEGYLLQKFRYLGNRAIILEPKNLAEKMLITCEKVIKRYLG